MYSTKGHKWKRWFTKGNPFCSHDFEIESCKWAVKGGLSDFVDIVTNSYYSVFYIFLFDLSALRFSPLLSAQSCLSRYACCVLMLIFVKQSFIVYMIKKGVQMYFKRENVSYQSAMDVFAIWNYFSVILELSIALCVKIWRHRSVRFLVNYVLLVIAVVLYDR